MTTTHVIRYRNVTYDTRYHSELPRVTQSYTERGVTLITLVRGNAYTDSVVSIVTIVTMSIESIVYCSTVLLVPTLFMGMMTRPPAAFSRMARLHYVFLRYQLF